MQSITEKFGAPPSLPFCPPAKIPPSLREMTLNITVSTPMAGGGVEPGEVDVKRPVRVPSVKGHLRYWWRMINLNSPDKDARESEIFGSTDSPGKVFFSISEQPGVKLRYSNNNYEFGSYGPENYALFSLKQNGNNIARENFSFTLSIRYPENYHDDVRLALSAWIYFGGIGARIRRGCGSLSCDKNPSSLGEILRAAPHIKLWRKKPGGSDPVSAWSEAVKNYRDYRQSKDGGKFGRSQWPEADSIRQITGKPIKTPARSPLPSFPRAALGMPIIFHFTGRGQPNDAAITPDVKDSSRMASPVITKALFDNGTWYSAVIILPHDDIFDIPLKINGREYNLKPVRGTIYRNTKPMQGEIDAISGFEKYISGKHFTKEGAR